MNEPADESEHRQPVIAYVLSCMAFNALKSYASVSFE
jgi:hypothetical protein